MISFERKNYGSSDEWLTDLKQDRTWKDYLERLQNASAAEVNKFREDALRRIGQGDTFELWDIYSHQVETVVEVIWGTGELSLTSLMIQTIGMLTLEWLEQHTEISKLDGNGIHLPKDLDTAKARKYFAKAIEKKYMTIENCKYRWIGTNDKGKISELAYFLGKVYNYVHTDNGNAGENFPEESLNNLFGVTRLYSSLTQVYNAQKPQRWRSMIDAMFKQG